MLALIDILDMLQSTESQPRHECWMAVQKLFSAYAAGRFRLRITAVLLSLFEIRLRGHHVFAAELHQALRLCRVPQQRSLNWIPLFVLLLFGGVPVGYGTVSPTTHAKKMASLVGHGAKWRERHMHGILKLRTGHAGTHLSGAWTRTVRPLQQPICHSGEVQSYFPLCRSSRRAAGQTSHRSGIGKAKARGPAQFWATGVRR